MLILQTNHLNSFLVRCRHVCRILTYKRYKIAICECSKRDEDYRPFAKTCSIAGADAMAIRLISATFIPITIILLAGAQSYRCEPSHVCLEKKLLISLRPCIPVDYRRTISTIYQKKNTGVLKTGSSF